MKKQMTLVLVLLVVCVATTNTAFGLHQYAAGYGFLWDQWLFNTINDWSRVGSAGYETYFNLPSEVDCSEDYLDAGTYFLPENHFKISLDIESAGEVVVPAGAWAGYEFTVPGTLPLEYINGGWLPLPGYFAFETDSMEIQITDGDGNVLWSSAPAQGWMNTVYTLDTFASSRTFRIIAKAIVEHQLHPRGGDPEEGYLC
jgi:hypothetical protein